MKICENKTKTLKWVCVSCRCDTILKLNPSCDFCSGKGYKEYFKMPSSVLAETNGWIHYKNSITYASIEDGIVLFKKIYENM